MLSTYEEDAISLGIRDLGPNKGRFHEGPCGNSPFRYGIKRNGTIVEWCTGCGKFLFPNHFDSCPNCKSRINHKNPKDQHLQKINGELRVVCPA